MFNDIINIILSNPLIVILNIVISYLLGSISFSVIITKKVNDHADIRQMGSGNAGFTNVLRSVGKLPAILTFAGDFFKGFLAVLIGEFLFRNSCFLDNPSFITGKYGAYIAGIFCILGHMYPCFFKFKGGKGIVTVAAMILVTDYRIFFILISIFLIVFMFSKIVSLSSLSAIVLYPFVNFLISYFIDYKLLSVSMVSINYILFITFASAIVSALIIFKHRANISRILNGTEKKLKVKK